jgi:hypothetical protein
MTPIILFGLWEFNYMVYNFILKMLSIYYTMTTLSPITVTPSNEDIFYLVCVWSFQTVVFLAAVKFLNPKR